MKKKTLLYSLPLFLLTASFFSFCNRNVQSDASGYYLNLSDTVSYVGMESCRTCHAGIYDSYIRTGMGQSFHFATKEKSAARFEDKPLYDSTGNFYYKPYWQGDSLYIFEYRLDGKDTIHRRTEKVNYIIGSGQHTNSHICSFNGYFFQAPVTFYTQKQQWDFAPGFEGGQNSRFSRAIGLECMTCHNGLPKFAQGSVNKYHDVMTGIDCERCHGAGGEHVRLKQAGVRVDTSKHIDYSIVNPRKLPRELQMSLCQRCHLQGLAVLKKGKDFDRFKPGMKLSEVWDVFLPETPGGRDKFIMASQAERLVMSRCYQRSEMTCITCHNPHISVKETPVEVFNNKCQSCHRTKTCSEKMEARKAANDNCSGCHLPKSGSIDIPHIFITDHFIRKDFSGSNVDSNEVNKVEEYLRLKCFTDEQPSAQTMAAAYLSFYEKFSRRDYLLDSAAAYLFSGEKRDDMPEDKIHYYFLKEDYNSLIAAGNKLRMDVVESPWTLYRVGEAHYASGNYVPAQQYFSEAVKRQPLNMEFQNKLAASLVQLGKFAEAKNVFNYIISEQPAFEAAWMNLGFLIMREGDFKFAEECFDRALALNPDYEMALLNKAVLCMNTGRRDEAKKLALRIMEINPKNDKAKLMLQAII